MSTFGASYILLWIVVIIQSALIVGLLNRLSQLRRPIALGSSGELQPGKIAPAFQGVDIRSGRIVRSSDFHGTTALLLVAPSCQSCKRMAHDLLTSSPEATLRAITVICVGGLISCRDALSKLSQAALVIQVSEDDAPFAYHSPGLPMIVSIDGDWHVLDVQHPANAADVLSWMDASPVVANLFLRSAHRGT